MILVRNHQPLLNGSKFVVLLIIVLFFSSCGIFNSSRNKENIKERVPLEDKDIGIDTMELSIIPASELPPIVKTEVIASDEKKYETLKKESYNISLLIPFNAESLESVNGSINNKFINYYAGVKLALKEFEKKGANMKVSIFDGERSEEAVKTILLNDEMMKMDVIIGPYDSESLKMTADFGKKNKIAVISPWLASTRITDDNPYYVQLRPSLTSHYYKIMEHVNQNFTNSEIVLIGRNDNADKNRFKFFQNANAALNVGDNPSKIQEFILKEDSLSYGDTAFDHLIGNGGRKAIIIPNWNYNDEDFIYACLRRLNIERGTTEVFVYGMPILYDSEKMDFDFYKNLNIRICLSEFVDWSDPLVKNFMKQYYEEYGDIPSSDAFEGYDMMTFIGSNILKYGVNFQMYLEDDIKRYLQTQYKIEQIFDEADEKFEKVKYLENKHLDLIQFIESKFVKIDG